MQILCTQFDFVPLAFRVILAVSTFINIFRKLYINAIGWQFAALSLEISLAATNIA